MVARVSLPAARRIALAAQGFLDTPDPHGAFNDAHTPDPQVTKRQVTKRQLGRTLSQLGVVQVDSVNVLTRAHYLPFFSRLGPYDTTLLDNMRDRHPRPMVESWAHMASIIPTDMWHLFDFRHARAQAESWGNLPQVLERNPGLVDEVLAHIDTHGPLTARACDARVALTEQRTRDHWGWNWNSVKTVVEYLFRNGRIVATGRNAQFERLYDLPERVLPAAALDLARSTSPAEAHIELVRTAAAALGVATRGSLADYFRMKATETSAAITHLIATGELEPVEVADLGEHFLYARARRPRKAQVATLVSPFDSLIWHRERTRQLFDMHYRIGIYTPAAKRTHGYYVLPFVYGDQLAARVDLKADRKDGVLRVQQLTWEAEVVAGQPAAPTPRAGGVAGGAGSDLGAGAPGEALARVLRSLADWLGLGEVV